MLPALPRRFTTISSSPSTGLHLLPDDVETKSIRTSGLGTRWPSPIRRIQPQHTLWTCLDELLQNGSRGAADVDQIIWAGEDLNDFGNEHRVKVRPSHLQLHQVRRPSQGVRERDAGHRVDDVDEFSRTIPVKNLDCAVLLSGLILKSE